MCGLVRGGCFQRFTGGSIYWSPGTPAVTVGGVLRDRWGSLGWEGGALGYPVAEPVCGLPDGGCMQDFQGATLVGGSTSAVRFVRGSIRTRWLAAGGAGGALGYPLTDEMCGLVRGGCFQLFQAGSVYWSPATGARIVTGAVRDRWGALGWETGRLGYPTGDTACGLPDSGCTQAFEGGILAGSDATGVRFTYGAIRTRWQASGGAAGALGLPTMDAYCGLRDGGCFQYFEHGAVYWSSSTGAHTVTGEILAFWEAAGWEWSRYGYPVEEPRSVGADVVQRFQRGTLTRSATDGVVRAG